MSGRSALARHYGSVARRMRVMDLTVSRKSLLGSRAAPDRSGYGQVVHPRRSAAVEGLLFRCRRTGSDALEGVPQLGVAAGLLVRRKVALEHAAIGAKSLDARLDILAPGGGELFRGWRQVALVEVEARTTSCRHHRA